jgi:hypothetical protein
LLVKLILSESGKWILSKTDKSALRLFDLYLAAENVLQPELEKHRVPVAYEWNKIKQNAWRVLHEDW